MQYCPLCATPRTILSDLLDMVASVKDLVGRIGQVAILRNQTIVVFQPLFLAE